MSKIAVVTDSTAVVSEQLKQHPDLFVLPIPVIIDGKPLIDSDIIPDEFYEMLKTTDQLPTTSQPSMGEVLTLYQSLAEQGYDTVISIHLSSGISGFINHLTTMAADLDMIKVYPFDSLLTSAPMCDMVTTALSLIDNGTEISTVLSVLHDMRDYQRAYLVVDDLKHLVHGGRLKNGSALIGSLLNIKPVLHFDREGKIVVYDKIRSAKKAYKRCQELIAEHYNYLNQQAKITIVHTAYEEKAQQIADELAKNLNTEVYVKDLGIVVGTHVGAKAIGFAITKQEDNV